LGGEYFQQNVVIETIKGKYHNKKS